MEKYTTFKHKKKLWSSFFRTAATRWGLEKPPPVLLIGTRPLKEVEDIF